MLMVFSVEFYIHFWDLIKSPLFCMYKECIAQKEMTTSMKQGIISLIPKPEKDLLLIDNWRPITLLTIDYKILALVYANRLKFKLDQIIAETQSGFVKGRHISNNIRLVLDLLDYSEFVHSDTIILFLDFYKAFDTIEHEFLLQSLKLFGFGDSFVNVIKMFYKEISSSVIVNLNTSQRFVIKRGVRQGCPISPFLFILVTELLSLSIMHNQNLKGISIFDREIKISQLADDTTLFLHDKSQLSSAIQIVRNFSCASGLKLNMSKCEIMSLHKCDDSLFEGIPVKDTIKYLGILLTKNLVDRQQLNFSSRIKKTQNILNLWLQRDLTLYGRVLLSKAEGLSRLVYPSLSLYVNDCTAKGVNKIFLDFIWKNRSHKLKKAVISNCRSDGGLEVLNFHNVINVFKINWIRRCLINSNSIWFFIPNFIFNKIGGLPFILKCNYMYNKLPVKLSKFHQQALLAWKLCYIHNFSPHKTLLWNNMNITVKNKSLFFSNWFNRDLIYLISLFDNSGNILSYERFMTIHDFPIPFKEYNTVLKAIPTGLVQLVKSHLLYNQNNMKDSALLLDGISIYDKKCNNKHIRQILQKRDLICPRGRSHWAAFIGNIEWRRAWLLPHKYFIPNKTKEVHFKILHKIYPVNATVSKYIDISSTCSFCGDEDETLVHLFYSCNLVQKFWSSVFSHLNKTPIHAYSFNLKDIICYYTDSHTSKEYIFNFFILFGKFFIHKQKFMGSFPIFSHFLVEVDSMLKSFSLTSNKKCDRFLKIYEQLFCNGSDIQD